MGFLTATTVKNFNFKNPRWRTAAILKTVKLQYLQMFDRFWMKFGTVMHISPQNLT